MAPLIAGTFLLLYFSNMSVVQALRCSITGQVPKNCAFPLTVFSKDGILYEEQKSTLEENLDPQRLLETSEKLGASEWNRYIFLREFLDYVPLERNDEEMRLEFMGKTTWDEFAHAFALMIGYRAYGDSILLENNLVPKSWEHLISGKKLPSITQFDDFFDYHLSRDLPMDDEEGLKLVLEVLMGVEMSKLVIDLANKGAVEVRRKLLLVQWLYIYDFLNTFPPSSRFTPLHLRE